MSEADNHNIDDNDSDDGDSSYDNNNEPYIVWNRSADEMEPRAAIQSMFKQYHQHRRLRFPARGVGHFSCAYVHHVVHR